MSELKTLKDFGSFKCGWMDDLCHYINPEELKAEAIKWVNSLVHRNDKPLAEWIIHFFNITKEDLKNG